jgi:hypothetical protein
MRRLRGFFYAVELAVMAVAIVLLLGSPSRTHGGE